MIKRTKLTPRRRRKRDAVEEDDIDGAEREPIPGEDCEAIVDDVGDEVVDGNDEHGVAVREVIVPQQTLSNHFGDITSYDNEENDDSGDDIWNDDTIPDPLSSDDEEEEAERESREDTIPPDEILALGKMFGCAYEFKQAFLRYSLKTRYDIKLYMSSQNKLGAVCSDTEYDCQWRCYCSYEKSKHKMQIKVYVNEHICVRSGYSKMPMSSSIAELFNKRLRLNPKLTAKEMAEEIKRNFNLIITDEQCRKAKTKITKERRASHEAHFSRIWDYEAEIIRKNPGTIMEIQTIPELTPGSKQRFNHMYVCFEAQRVAWKTTCRPIIRLDGVFLKWDVKGQLIAAVGRDGDNRIVPIAWAVVEIENDVNWLWFVDHLKQDLSLGDGSNISIISDKQKGLVKAVHNELPQAEHRMCARHILGNWKRDSGDPELEQLFWKIACSYTQGDYADNMAALMSYSKSAYDSLQKTNPPTWSRAFFKVGSCCNDNLNNLNESFNRTIRESRRKPLLELFEEIRRQCMVRTAKRSIIANRLKTRFTKIAHAEIEKAIELSKECIRYMSTDDLHEIDYHNCGHSVDMHLKTCGCRMWQLNGIPCHHAACVILAKKQKVDDYVSEYFTIQMLHQTYEHSIRPVEGMKLWPRLNRLPVMPPPNRLGNCGRPSNHARRKSINEAASSSKKTKLTQEKRIMTCSNCREEGHNILSCSRPSVEPKAKRPRGRLRKD